MGGGWTCPLIRGCTGPRWDRMDLRSKRQISTNQRGGTHRLGGWLRGDLVLPSRAVAHRCMTRAIHDPNARRRVPKRSRNQPRGDPQREVEKPLRAWCFFPPIPPRCGRMGGGGSVAATEDTLLWISQRTRHTRRGSLVPTLGFPRQHTSRSSHPVRPCPFPPHAQRTRLSPSLLHPSVLCALGPSPWFSSSIRSGSIGQAGSRPGFRLVEVDFQGDGRATWTISPSTTRRVQFRVSFANSPRASSDLLFRPSTERRPWLPPPSYSKLWPRPSASTRSPR